ncbi:sulfate transport system permease protein [Caulobacter ginsengisoli]|uniref:Sulfate transport system permease protein CysT n=1 Tax=Caulobacter ginsengisoli TaxID=400775 RepID=A0ABU0IT36_9CAUL|nr:sulfate ABC transporter permease subunit CysT [Caulobacter ginsengisoli]MDQ0465172.1 sulfate transport system permease protein [Caulobacter ginsengisoli]
MAALTARRRLFWRDPGVLPGFGLSLGFTIFYLSVIVLIPLTALALRPWEHGVHGILKTLSEPRVLASLRLSFGAAALAAGINAVMGLIVTWVLVRQDFPGRKIVDALVDLPFALPTAVAGIALTTIYGPHGPLGELFARVGIKTAYSPLGVVIALAFVGLPFVVRTLQPVMQDMRRDVEEAAETLGANAIQRAVRIILPAIAPALITGTGLAFARAVGEYGSVIFIAGNMPMVSEISPLLIVIKLEQYDYAGAATVGLAMLGLSFGVLLVFNLIQLWLSSRGKVR